MLDARIADRVHCDAKAALDRGECAAFEVVHEDAEAERLPADGRVERDRDAPVGEQLHRADSERLVAFARRRTVETRGCSFCRIAAGCGIATTETGNADRAASPA